MCNEEASFTVAKSATYGEGRISAVMFSLEVRGGNIIKCAQKNEIP